MYFLAALIYLCAEIFEKWRVVDTSTLPPAKHAEFEQDKKESNRRYDAAFGEVLSHTTEPELSAFWKAFGVHSLSHDTWIKVALQPQTNPMYDSENSTHTTLQPAPHTNDAAAPASVKQFSFSVSSDSKEAEHAVI